jgi:hypothetical protein
VATDRDLLLFNEKGKVQEKKLPASTTGLAWCPSGEWLLSTPKALVLFDRNLSTWETLVSVDDLKLSGAVASPNGKFFAFRIDRDCVGIVGRVVGQLGTVQYRGRTVGELEFGPHPNLGIGIGMGDGNLVSLLSDQVHRTDPPPGRTRNRWLVGVSIDTTKVAAELGTKVSTTKVSQGGGCFGVILTLAVLLVIAIGMMIV